MLRKKQVLILVSIAVMSFLVGTMFNFTIIATGGSGSPWDRVWTTISELQSKVDSLNASLIELENRVNQLEAKEELKFLSFIWSVTNYIDLRVKNTGSVSLTMSSIQVNSAAPTAYDFDTGTVGNQTFQSVAAGSSYTVRIWHSFLSGTKYVFAILTSRGNTYTFICTAP